jgi:hypothetical protein
MGASSMSQIPSANSFMTDQPSSTASRVLPTPPVPVKVINLCFGSTLAIWRSSVTRPTNSVIGHGRFPFGVSTVTSG